MKNSRKKIKKKSKNALILVTIAHPDDGIFKKREIFNFSETSSMIRHFLSFEPSTQVQPTQRQEKMEFCSLASDWFLNSSFLNTLVSAILSGLLVLATILIAICQYKFQKRSHEQKLLADRENRILDIYNTFADCGYVFMSGYSSVNIRLGILPDTSALKRLQEHQVNLNKAYHAARLIFDEDAQILKQLKAILDKFLQLSSREQELLLPQGKAFVEAMNVVQKAFPNRSFATLQDIIAVPEAFDMLNKLASNSGIQELEKEIAAFKKNELSDENLDNYFKPYINRIR